jgi:hypothetical protein
MINEDTNRAFYEGRRTRHLSLVLNDAVTVIAGARSGSIACVIAPQATEPAASYLIEYEDGSSEVRASRDLRRHDNGA